ncbi:unnamed protein product [Nesidiocoris tenuis]|uniref:Uncharacterized protein n=1 Tax=Nesidiocoris tenuis TaxID=355587 RepID=A0A6H5GHC2_9HEMI|nr:unnamed protein product [Nesidiocoris tenuis]
MCLILSFCLELCFIASFVSRPNVSKIVIPSPGIDNSDKRSSFYANEAGDTVVANQFFTGLDKLQSSDQWSNKEQNLPIRAQFRKFQSKYLDDGYPIGNHLLQRESHYVHKSRNSKYYETDPKDEDNSFEKLLRSEQKAKQMPDQNDVSVEPKRAYPKSARKGLFSRKMSQKATSRISSAESEHDRYVHSYRRRKNKKKSPATPSTSTKTSTEADNFNWDFPIFDELDKPTNASNLKPKNQDKPKNKGFSGRKRNQASLSISDEAPLENSHPDHPSENSVRSRTLAERFKQRQLDMNRRKLSGLRSNQQKQETARRFKSDSREEESDDLSQSTGEQSKINYRRKKPYANHRVKISDVPETDGRKVGSWDIFYPTERTNSKFENLEDSKSKWAVVSPTAQVKRQRQPKPQALPHLKDNSLRRGLPKSTMRKLEDQRRAESRGNSENRHPYEFGLKSREFVRPIPVPDAIITKFDAKYGQKKNSDIPEKSNTDYYSSYDQQVNDQEEREDNSADDPGANGHPENEWINRKQLEKMLNKNQGSAGKLSVLGRTETKGQGGSNGADSQAKPQKPIFIDDRPGDQDDRSADDAPMVPEKIPHNEDPQESSPGKATDSQTINAGTRNLQDDNTNQAAQTPKQNDRPREIEGNESEMRTDVTSSPAKTSVKKSGKEIKYVVFDPSEFNATKLRAVLQEFQRPVGQIPQCSLDEYQSERAGMLKNIKRREGTDDELSR